MLNETLSFGIGECPIIRPEGIYYGGRKVISLDPGLSSVGVGDVGDLLAYRQEWDPFIAAHIDLWRELNALLESNPAAQKCPPGIFTNAQIKDSDPTGFCAALQHSRMRVSNTDPGGILTQWNAWKDKSSADILAGASAMLQFHQDVVLRVGGPYTKELLDIVKIWKLAPVQLPDLPSFTVQQQIRARIEGAYISTKGVIQLLGYSAGELLGEARDLVDATAKGLTDTAKALPSTIHWMGIAAAGVAVAVGGALIVYYVPRRQSPQLSPG